MVRENFLQKFPAHFSQPHPDANPKDKVLYPQGPTWIKQRRERSDVPRKILMEPAPQAAQECGWPEGRALPVVVSSVWSGGLGSVFSWTLEGQGLLAEGTYMCKAERSETQGSWNWLEHTWSLRKRRDVGLEERGRGPTLQAFDGPAEECQPG